MILLKLCQNYPYKILKNELLTKSLWKYIIHYSHDSSHCSANEFSRCQRHNDHVKAATAEHQLYSVTH